MQKVIVAALAALILLIVSGVTVHADSLVPSPPFYFVSEDGSRIFHFTPIEDTWAHYPPTGLYYNTNPPTLIYLVENPCMVIYAESFFFSHDLHYFAWIPIANAIGIGSDVSQATAVVFFAGGQIQATYMVTDIVHNMRDLHRTVSTVRWHQHEEFCADSNLLTIHMSGYRTVTFDITTGLMIDRTGPIEWRQALLIAGVILSIFLAYLVIKQRSQRLYDTRRPEY